MLSWKSYRMAIFSFSFQFYSFGMSFKNNPVRLVGRQSFCERLFRGWKAERTMNEKHLVFTELNKNALYLDLS